MKPEQIEDLRRRIDLSPGAITSPMIGNAELARLLLEREKLLKALRAAAMSLGDARSTLSHCWASETPPDKGEVGAADAAEDAAKAAIAFAEEGAG